jgi:putative transferase (TIGR04331 family)
VVSRFLITTAEKRTWETKNPVVFLGDWCKLHEEKDSWKNLNFITKDYHWGDRELLYNDYQYLQNLYEKIIIAFARALNKFHKVEHSNRYWEVLIGPWLYNFIQILFDRWAMIEKVSHDKISGTIIFKDIGEFLVPKNWMNFSKLSSEDLWNHWIYGEIIKLYDEIPIIEVPFDKENLSDLNSPENNKFKKFVKMAVKKYSYLSRNSKYFFFNSSFKKNDQLKLELALKQLPTFYDFSLTNEIEIIEVDRSRFNLNFRASNKFESFLLQMIPQQIPTYYLEGFSSLKKECKNRYLPTCPEVIVTSSSIISNDIFKFWVAEKIEKGSKLIVSQHGGHYGVGKWNASERHEISVADSYISWGWKEKGVFPIGSANLSGSKKKKLFKRNNSALLVLGLVPRYSYWLYSIPISSQWGNYIDDQIIFLESLPKNISKILKIRLSPNDYGWGHKKRLVEKLPFLKFDELQNTFESSIRDCKIFIGTYNATTFLETLSLNIPTIIFWNPKHWEIRQSAEPYFSLLHQAGILHYTPQSAASHLTKIWNNADEWWSQEKTQKAKLTFINNYARTSDNFIIEWKEFIENN